MRKIFLFMALCLTTVFAAKAADEIYAVWDASTTTLTLRYDDQREANNGVTNWWYDATMKTATKVVLDISMQNALPTSTYRWFYEFDQLTEIQNLDYLNTSEVTNMYLMFDGCKALQSLDLNSFNTAKVEDMNSMFDGCESLTSLDLSSFNTEKVTDMGVMFMFCHSLSSIKFGASFNTANVTSMGAMFYQCLSLSSLDVSSFNTEKVTDMSSMFSDCTALTSLKFGASFNTANVEYMETMFSNSKLLSSLDLSSFNTAKVTTMEGMFANCPALTSLDLSSFNTENVTTMEMMFYNCTALTTIYWNEDLSQRSGLSSTDMFDECTSLKGGNGTVYDWNHIDAAYARPDEVGNPGYFTKKTTTGIEQTNEEMKKCENVKLLHNGQLLIEKNGKTYNMMGGEVR